MIAFRDNLPLIELCSGQVVAFERTWLLHALANAARKAGYKRWWLAPHVAESVTLHFESQPALNVLPVATLENAVQNVLQVIGYSEIGQHFSAGKPITQISVLDLAREAGSGYELAFFDLLGRRLQLLVDHQHTHFQIVGLQPCVKLLRARKSWCRDCNSLQAEIVAFAREQTGLAAAGHEVSFTLA